MVCICGFYSVVGGECARWTYAQCIRVASVRDVVAWVYAHVAVGARVWGRSERARTGGSGAHGIRSVDPAVATPVQRVELSCGAVPHGM